MKSKPTTKKSIKKAVKKPAKVRLRKPSRGPIIGVLALFVIAGVAWQIASRAAISPAGPLLVSVPVIKTASGSAPILSTTVTLQPGQKAYLYNTPILVKVNSWGTGKPTNVGYTQAMKCTTADGRQVLNGHWAANIRPADSHLSPSTRVLLDQPAGGTFTCVLTAAAYSTGAASGMKLGVYAADTEPPKVNVSIFTNASTWTSVAANNASGFSIAPGKTLSYMTQILNIPHGAASWVLVADGQVSTCKDPQHYVPVCKSSKATIKSSTLKTWIQILPVKADGTTQCAPPVLSAARSWAIDDARHHQTLTNSLTLLADSLQDTTKFPAACPKAKVSLRAQVTAGDYAIAHDGYNYAHSLSLVRP